LNGVSTKISFLNDSSIAVTLDGKIVLKNLQPSLPVATYKSLKAATANSSLAIEYNKQLMVFSSNSTNIIITDFNGTVIDEVQLPSAGNVVALAFNANDELLVITDTPSLFIWTSLPCPQNFTIINQVCACRDTFVPIEGSCICPNNLVLINESCGCR
jgi:hypothetical protein